MASFVSAYGAIRDVVREEKSVQRALRPQSSLRRCGKAVFMNATTRKCERGDLFSHVRECSSVISGALSTSVVVTTFFVAPAIAVESGEEVVAQVVSKPTGFQPQDYILLAAAAAILVGSFLLQSSLGDVVSDEAGLPPAAGAKSRREARRSSRFINKKPPQ
eukprot:CAMPEP_0185849862 /NCGR_PEP_ID=MMETSP1354-20130828/4219_1 /TAXON_ID=708628 /ORGANISM="Erythrolobus madagascarensis, Strain CCMP3276" /LENGTH=161 /DNA_ID=CAMNT_0028550465 /DNA_START=157 /DNA_END=642 /DNA_ORIENTATION=+